MQTPTDTLTLVLDQGSHASRVAVFSTNGTLLQLVSQSIDTHNTGDLFEQDAKQILDSFKMLLPQIKADYLPHITNCGICTQRSSIIAWDKESGLPLSPVISWRDLRAQAYIKSLNIKDDEIREITGLPLSAHYSAAKIHWLLDHNTAVARAKQAQKLCIAPLASYLLFHLLQEQPYVIDHSNAQRTQLFNIKQLEWSDELLSLFQINSDILPELTPVIHHYGHLKQLNTPVTCVCGDQNAALHAYPPLNNNNSLINIGTGAFILSPSAEKSQPHQLLHTIASSQLDKKTVVNYVTEGTVNGAGTAIDWALREWPVDNLFSVLPEWLNDITSPPIFINTVAGLGSPWWSTAGEPTFIGDANNTSDERYVGIIESIVFLIFTNLQQLKIPQQALFVSGGLAQLDGLCQKLADLSSASVIRHQECETSARGCAWLSRQLDGKDADEWLPLDVEKSFLPAHNPQLIIRYQQFVGELEKRCSSS